MENQKEIPAFVIALIKLAMIEIENQAFETLHTEKCEMRICLN